VELVLAIIVGIVGGFVGSLPFIITRTRLEKRLPSDASGSIIVGMVATFVSFVIMGIEIFLCWLVARVYLLPFALVAIAVFIIVMLGYTMLLVRRFK
jgi:hypothetical protein